MRVQHRTPQAFRASTCPAPAINHLKRVGGRQCGDGLVRKGKRACQRGHNVVLLGQLRQSIHIHLRLKAADDTVEKVIGLRHMSRLLCKRPHRREFGLLPGTKIAWLGAKSNLSAGMAFTALIISLSIMLNCESRASPGAAIVPAPAHSLCRPPALPPSSNPAPTNNTLPSTECASQSSRSNLAYESSQVSRRRHGQAFTSVAQPLRTPAHTPLPGLASCDRAPFRCASGASSSSCRGRLQSHGQSRQAGLGDRIPRT